MNITRDKELKVIYLKCKRSFLFYVRYMFKNMYGNKYIVGRHHIAIAHFMERVVRGEILRGIINIAPRYGKTELVVKMFISWCLAFNPRGKFLHLSYSDSLALDNSASVMETIKSDAYRELFGEVKMKKSSESKKLWNTEQGGGMYSAAAGGQVTGFGSGRLEPEGWDPVKPWLADFYGATIIDDPNKPEDAGSALALELVRLRFESTVRNRVNGRLTPIIVIGQRIDPEDLSGYLIALEPDTWEVLTLPCITEKGTALWDHKHSLEALKDIRKADSLVFDNQYMQDPSPREGLMYREFSTYDKLPELKIVKSYTDTADEGKDFLCSIVYGVPAALEDESLYLLDVLYTSQGMEVTEPLQAEQLVKFSVRRADIESNNGGRGFARNVSKWVVSEEEVKGTTFVSWFHQTLNKQARIYSNSASVNSCFKMPKDWKEKHPKFYKSIMHYKKEGGNKHDDGPDTLTGCYEKTKSFRAYV